MKVFRTTDRKTISDAYGVHVKDAYELVKMYKKPVHYDLGELKINDRIILGGKLMEKESYFDGGLLQLIGWKLLGGLVIILTLGICTPWAICMEYNWEVKHTVINGKRLAFDGTAIELFGNWIKWFLLCIITLGIYIFWLHIALKKWITKHTHFVD